MPLTVYVAELRGKSLWIAKALSLKSRAKFRALDAFKYGPCSFPGLVVLIRFRSLGGRLAPQSVLVFGSIAMDLNAEMMDFPNVPSPSVASSSHPQPGELEHSS